MTRIRNLRPTPGVLIGTIALVFALSGAAVAATKIQTNDIAKKAVTGAKIAPDSVKGGKIRNGSVKAGDLAEGVIPVVPTQAYGRVNKAGATVAPATGSVGITGATNGGVGQICLDLAEVPIAGTATVVAGAPGAPGSTVELLISPPAGCAAPYNDALVVTKLASNQTLEDEDVYVQFVR